MTETRLFGVEFPVGLSEDDAQRYALVIANAMNVHVERDKVRQGLWKQYSSRDQAQTIKYKIERVLAMLSQEKITEDILKEVISEYFDIINYAVFGVRLARGRQHV